MMKIFAFLFLIVCGAPMLELEGTSEEMLKAILNERMHGAPQTPKLNLRPLREDELSEGDVRGKYIPRILEIPDVLPGDVYEINVVRQDNQSYLVGMFKANQDKELINTNNKRPFSGYHHSFWGIRKGEVATFTVVCKKRKIRSVLTFSPNPIEANWSDGAKVEVTSLSDNMEIFLLRCTNLTPGETIHYESKSWDEVNVANHTVEPDGTLTVILAPMVVGKSGGINTITLERVASGETRHVYVPFGHYTYKFIDRPTFKS